MLSFAEKKAIFDEFEELAMHEVSLKRLNYHFEESAVPKTTVVKFLHPNGNAFIYAGYLPEEDTMKGYISVLEEDAEMIRQMTADAIEYLKKTVDGYEEGYQENWVEDHGDYLTLEYRNGMWSIIMSSGALEAIFKTRDAAVGYLEDEGFFEE